MDDAVIASMAAALAAEEEEGGLPATLDEVGAGGHATPRGRTRHTDSVSSEDSLASNSPSLLLPFSRSPVVPTKYFIGRWWMIQLFNTVSRTGGGGGGGSWEVCVYSR
jgi:hypothetical protein